MRSKKFQVGLIVPFLALFLCAFTGCEDSEEAEEPGDLLSSRAYKGHENDVDANNLCNVYPSVVGTRLDDCQTCHTGRIEEGKLASNACDYCHNLMLHETGHTFMETLNPYGLDYFYTAQNDLEYSGYEAKLLFWLVRDRLQLGMRYDKYGYKPVEGRTLTDQNNLTLGANFIPTNNIRLQLNYVFKETLNDVEPDLDDNILFLNFQYSVDHKSTSSGS